MNPNASNPRAGDFKSTANYEGKVERTEPRRCHKAPARLRVGGRLSSAFHFWSGISNRRKGGQMTTYQKTTSPPPAFAVRTSNRLLTEASSTDRPRSIGGGQ